MSAPRVAILGARRVRQGLAPFVARDLHACGARVVAVLTTKAETAESAARELDERYGIRARPYAGLGALLARERLDALAILSPAASHEALLRAALEARLHVLCEKPLLWEGEGLVARAAPLVEGFRERGLLLAENCQWPFTLPAFDRLHPDRPPGPPRRFTMELAPRSQGPAMLGDALPHPLSLLQALAPGADARLEGVQLREAAGPEPGLDLDFDYCAGRARVASHVRLRRREGPPRPAGYALDGRRADRRIALPSYRMELCDGERAVPLPDPLTARVQDFCNRLRAVYEGAQPPPDPAPLLRRVAMLETALKKHPARAAPPR